MIDYFTARANTPTGRKTFDFETCNAFPTIHEDDVQTAVMVAKDENGESLIYFWNCATDETGRDVWFWEPYRHLDETGLNDLKSYLKEYHLKNKKSIDK